MHHESTLAAKEKTEPTIEELHAEAAALTKDVAGLDAQMKALSTERAEKNKKLRSVTSKMVTLQLKSA